MSNDSLIGKLKALRPNADAPELSELAYRHAVDDCISIIRQHSASEGDVVERLSAYLNAKKEVNGLHPEVIHVIHANGGKHELRVSDLEAAIAAMGDVRKDADSAITEISVVDDEEIMMTMMGVRIGSDELDDLHISLRTAQRLLNVLRPYLRTTEPEPVSLEAYAQVAASVAVGGNPTPWEDCAEGWRIKQREIAKAVLDAAGVKYVD